MTGRFSKQDALLNSLKERFLSGKPYSAEDETYYQELYQLLQAGNKAALWTEILRLPIRCHDVPMGLWEDIECVQPVLESLSFKEWYIELPETYVPTVMRIFFRRAYLGKRNTQEYAQTTYKASSEKYLIALKVILETGPSHVTHWWIKEVWHMDCNNVEFFKQVLKIVYDATGIIFPLWGLAQPYNSTKLETRTVHQLLTYGVELKSTVQPSMMGYAPENYRWYYNQVAADSDTYQSDAPEHWLELLTAKNTITLFKELHSSSRNELGYCKGLQLLMRNDHVKEVVSFLLSESDYEDLNFLLAETTEVRGLELLLAAGATPGQLRKVAETAVAGAGFRGREVLPPAVLQQLPVFWVQTNEKESALSLIGLAQENNLTMVQVNNLLDLVEAGDFSDDLTIQQLLELVKSA